MSSHRVSRPSSGLTPTVFSHWKNSVPSPRMIFSPTFGVLGNAPWKKSPMWRDCLVSLTMATSCPRTPPFTLTSSTRSLPSRGEEKNLSIAVGTTLGAVPAENTRSKFHDSSFLNEWDIEYV